MIETLDPGETPIDLGDHHQTPGAGVGRPGILMRPAQRLTAATTGGIRRPPAGTREASIHPNDLGFTPRLPAAPATGGREHQRIRQALDNAEAHWGPPVNPVTS
jgi:hypothetical protein